MAIREYQGQIDTAFVHNTLANHINGPFFTSRQVGDASVVNVVRRIWWEFEHIDFQIFMDDGREYLSHLMDLAASWRVRSDSQVLNPPQKALLRYNSALIMMCVSETLDESEDEK